MIDKIAMCPTCGKRPAVMRPHRCAECANAYQRRWSERNRERRREIARKSARRRRSRDAEAGR